MPSDPASSSEDWATKLVVQSVLAVIPALVVGALTSMLVGLGTCGGDGGAPRAAPGTTAAGYCAHVPSVLFGVPLAAIIIGTVVSYRSRFSVWLWLWVGVAVVFDFGYAVWGINLGS